MKRNAILEAQGGMQAKGCGSRCVAAADVGCLLAQKEQGLGALSSVTSHFYKQPRQSFLKPLPMFSCFSFQDFDIQGSRRCSLDWLTIETYKNIESYRACGSTVPPPYISSQDHVWIRFHSDDSVSRKGFRLAYFSGVFLKRNMLNHILWC